MPIKPSIEQVAKNDVVKLDPTQRSLELQHFEEDLAARLIGQPDGVRAMVNAYKTAIAGLNAPHRPISSLLLLGPTGVGKTRIVEATADILFGSPESFIKIDCAEFQHSHEIAKIIGAPPGYLGFRESNPAITQAKLDKSHTNSLKLSLILFDEIEKASESLWQLLLGVLDKATLTLGDSQKVDFSRTIVCMSSNLAADKMSRGNRPAMGFTDTSKINLSTVGIEAVKRKFTPEFVNRLSEIVTFKPLGQAELERIFRIEMQDVQDRIIQGATFTSPVFILAWTAACQKYCIDKSNSREYGARDLKRVIEREIVQPLTNIILTRQVDSADTITVDVENNGLVFLHSYR